MISDFLILPNKNISEAIEQLEKAKGLGLIVVDENNVLLGSLTDGDIRRAIISGKNLTDSIKDIFHHNPKTAFKSSTAEELKSLTANRKIKLIPILEGQTVVDVFTINDEDTKDVPVVIMAGGLGSRLGHHTKDIPKPMVDVGGKPVLERILKNFTKVGFKKFFFSVNYKSEVIEEYFKDGSEFSAQITYVKETKRLGTAGSLSLLPSNIKGPIVVTNGDLLTLVDFRHLIGFHNEHRSPITMCTRKYELQVPFGVVNIQGGKVLSIDEKPTHTFNVSAGVYVIDSDLLKNIPKDEYFDMPTFIQILMENHISVQCFPMVEQWIDIGQVSDLDYARSIYQDQQ